MRRGARRAGVEAAAPVAESPPRPLSPLPNPPPPPPRAVPIFYDAPPAAGPAPAPRWGHAAASLGGRIYVIGGVGAAVFDDVASYEPAAGAWRAVQTATNPGRGGQAAGPSSSGSASSDGPGPVFGAAAAASGTSIFVYGGRQGRTFLRSTHEFRPADGAWRALPPPPPSARAAPPAVAGHTLTACGRHGLVLFGGGGKRVSGAAWRLDPAFGVWHKLWEPGAPGPAGPRPRHGHSAVWAHSPDRLVIFGGAGADGTAYADAWALDLAERTWARADTPPQGAPAAVAGRGDGGGPGGGDGAPGSPAAAGSLMAALRAATGGGHHTAPPPAAAPAIQPGAPCPRFSHCGAMLPVPAGEAGGAQKMWVFGGCTPGGTFLNDAHVLDLGTGLWVPAPAVGPAPPPRYGHSATVVGGGEEGGGGGGGEGGSSTADVATTPRLIVYGGSDARQPFGTVISVVTDFGPALGAAAADMVGDGWATATPPPPSHPDPDASTPSLTSVGSIDDGITTSLRTSTDQTSWLADALRKRSASEAHAAAARAAAASDAAARAERARADALAADLAAARVLLEDIESASAAAAVAAAARVADAREAIAAADDRAADAIAAAGAARETAAAASAGAEASDRARVVAEACAADASTRADRAAADARAAVDLVAAARRERDAAREAGAVAAAAAARSAAGEADARAAATALARHVQATTAPRPGAEPPAPPPVGDLTADPATAAAALEALADTARGRGGVGGASLTSTPLPALRALAAAASSAASALRYAVEARLEAELTAARAGPAECKVCMDAPPDTVFFPCGHRACGACAGAAGGVCPFCRRAVTDVARLYDV